MQNSLDRLLEGIATSLRRDVLPEVRDPYARGQVSAAVDLLTNLAERVAWRPADLLNLLERARQVLRAADAAAPGDVEELAGARTLLADPLPSVTDDAALVRARDTHLKAVASVQRWAAQEIGANTALLEKLRERIDDFVLWDHDREFTALRFAHRRAKRL